MNEEYINELYDNNKNLFNDKDINSKEDLRDLIIDYITSNMQYDYDIDIDIKKLFNLKKEKDLDIDITDDMY